MGFTSTTTTTTTGSLLANSSALLPGLGWAGFWVLLCLLVRFLCQYVESDVA